MNPVYAPQNRNRARLMSRRRSTPLMQLSVVALMLVACTKGPSGGAIAPGLEPPLDDPHASAGRNGDNGDDEQHAPDSGESSDFGGDAGLASSGDGDSDGDRSSLPPDHVDTGDDAGVDETVHGPLEITPFVYAAHDPFSTFAADVDSASYDLFRAFASSDVRLSSSLVRVEEFVNSFKYEYEAPALDAADPFSIALETAPGILGRDTLMLRVGIQGKLPPSSEKKPANVVFLVDVSGSMQSPDKLPVAQRLLTHALDVLDETDTVSIVSYAGDTQVRLTPTPVLDRDRIVEVIEGLEAAGSTNGEGGIQLAYQQAQAGFIEGGINHVVLCTDGDFNVGVSNTDELVQMIAEKRETGVTLTALGFGATSNDELMEAVSNAGNGIYSVLTREADADRYAEEKLLSTLVIIAKDMKIQVEMNPEHVLAYRLIGYDDRAIADQDFRNDVVDAGEVGAGHRVTALYELVLKGGALPEVALDTAFDGEPVSGEREVGASELVRIKVRYKQPGASAQDPASEVVQGLAPSATVGTFDDASRDTQFAIAIAAWAEVLRQSPYIDDSVIAKVSSVFEAQASRDADRAELLELFNAVK